MNLLLFLPLIIPLTAGALSIPVLQNNRIQAAVSLFSSLAMVLTNSVLSHVVASEGVRTKQLGGWPAPFGISLVADHFTALMLLLVSILGFCVVLFSLAEVSRSEKRSGFFPALQMYLMGTNGALLAGDIFNLYVWFEVILISSLVLLTLGRTRNQIRAAIPFAVLNLLASALFLSSIGVLYGKTGALNLSDLYLRIGELPRDDTTIEAGAALLLTALGIKSAVFPLFFWLPPAYAAPSLSVSALLAGISTKVGVYALIRVFTLLFADGHPALREVALLVAVITMIVGVLGALAQFEIRRLLAFHVISQVGYMVFGLALFSRAGLAGAIFFIIHNILAKSALFLVGGIIRTRSGTGGLRKLGGFMTESPLLSFLFAVAALSLAGVPPLPGFWGKLMLVEAGLSSGAWVATGVALFVGVLTLFSMSKIWNEAFWKPTERIYQPLEGRRRYFLHAPVVILSIVILAIGVFPGPLAEYSEAAASGLLNPHAYVFAVLEGDS